MGLGASTSSGAYSEQTKKSIDDALASGPLVVFSASYCPYCTRVKKLLEPWQPFTIIEVDQMGNMNEYKSYLSEITGASKITWPRVFIGGKCVGGCDDTTKLQKNGQLQKLIDEAKNKTESSKL